ncbi:MAG TPA: ATP-binding cassette domain-containing protein [Turneriella sp.]|nr:ATP-binding cassette domain-containing protein [Turneriella sp.]
MASVNFEGVHKIYPNGYVGVEDFNLTIGDGEFMIFVGPSGCGKSTTMRMVAGLEDISRGTITIGDKVVNTVPPRDRDIAMVFQDYAHERARKFELRAAASKNAQGRNYGAHPRGGQSAGP